MKRNLLLSLVTCLVATAATAAISGAWTANFEPKDNDRVYFNLTRGPGHAEGTTYRLRDFTGLTAEQVQAAARTDVRFELRREAGTVAFEGSFRDGRGAGQFSFTPNRDFAATLRAMNFRIEDLDDDGDRESEESHLYFLTSIDLSTAYLEAMQAEGFRGKLDTFVEMRMFGVTPEYSREMRSLLGKLTTEELVEGSMHGVTPDYVRRTRAYGWKLDFEHLVETRIHGATPEFADELKKVGYSGLTEEQLVEMRIFGVTPKFIRELADAGYEHVPVDKLVEMKMHGIDAKFLQKMSAVKP
jgi:hypothetical protein